MRRLGIHLLETGEVLDWFERCLAEDISGSAYFGLDGEGRALHVADAARFSLLFPRRAGPRTEEGFSLDALRAASPDEGVRLLAGVVLEEISRILRLPEAGLAPDAPLAALGMDSLMGVELSLALEQKFGLSDYSPSLTDKVTSRDLAQALYPILVNGRSDEAGQAGLLARIAEEHGLRLSAAQREDVLGALERFDIESVEPLSKGLHGKSLP
jgi:acyl carrier protein